jgi:hypothetical protein
MTASHHRLAQLLHREQIALVPMKTGMIADLSPAGKGDHLALRIGKKAVDQCAADESAGSGDQNSHDR